MTGSDRRQQEREERLSPAKRALLARMRAGRAQEPRAAADPGLARPVLMRSPSAPRRSLPGRLPVVLVHPVGGALFCYGRLVAALAVDAPVYGLAADGVDLGGPPRQALPQLAARYLRGLAAAGVGSGCVLAGWSMGGLVAYEMARQLAAATGRNNPVVLIDTMYVAGDVPWGEAEIRRAFVHDIGRLAGAEPVSLPDAGRPGDPQAGLTELLAAAGVDLGLGRAELDRRYRIFKLNSRAMTSYRPASYPGPVTLINAAGTGDLEAVWRPLVGSPIRRHAMPGDHYQMLEPGRVETVARVLDQVVRSASQPAV